MKDNKLNDLRTHQTFCMEQELCQNKGITTLGHKAL